jgi:PST family polysaccharide transporter
MLRSYAALIAGTIANAVAGTILSYALQSYRPAPSLARWRDALRFSRWLLLSNVLHAAYRRADAFSISKLLGAGAVGVYSVAFEIAALPAELLLLPIRRALLPGYAQLARDADRLRAVFVDGFALTLLFVMPVAVGMALTADSLVRIVLGTRWLDAIPLIQVLAFLGCFRACSSNFSQVYVALGRPQLTTRTIAVTAALGVPLIVGGAYFGGALGAAYMVTAAGAFNVVITFTLATRLLGLSSARIVGPVARTALATAAMAAPVLAIGLWWGQAGSARLLAVKFVTQVFVGACVFVSAQWLLWRISGSPRGPESQIIGFGRGWLAKLLP